MIDNKILRESLDDDQYAAVMAPLGNVLCVANAGSGKTRVLTYRIAHLIDMGEPESSFLMLTFTNKAAKEMIDRIKILLDKKKLQITGGTFHSIANKFIKRYHHLLGYDGKITILNNQDSVGLMGVALEYYCAFHNISSKTLPPKKDIHSVYSYCRNKRLDIREHLKMNVDPIAVIVDEYESRKRAMNAMDFDDLLICFDKLLDFPAVRNHIHQTMPNVFVDEFQDINIIQDSIIHKLTEGVNRLTAVGDDAQCIYGFRGSEIQFIQSFRESYPGASIFPIRNNYRSTDKIINLALSVINESSTGSRKEMIATQESSCMPTCSEFYSEKEQGDYIARQIQDAHTRGIPYGEMAVLCRLNYLARSIELALNNARIPVSMECGIKFYDRVHVRLSVDLFKFIANPKNQIAFWNLMETTEGIGPKTARKMFALFEEREFNIGSLSTIKVPKKSKEAYSTLVDAIMGTSGLLSDPAVIQRVQINNESKLQTVFRLFKANWLDQFLKKAYKEKDLKSRQKDLATFYAALADFDEVDDFLEIVALVGDEEKGKTDNKVRIMSIHKAKGLEWDKVFIPYLNEQILPHDKNSDYEEERRLFYVAITRGRKEVDMSFVRFIESMKTISVLISPFLLYNAHGKYTYKSNTPLYIQ